MLPGVSSRAPCSVAYRCQLHVTGGSARSPPVLGGHPPLYDCMCAELLPAADVGPCHATVTPAPPTSDSRPEASARYLPAGNRPLIAAPVQSASQHITVKHASFLYEFSGLHGCCFSNDESSFGFLHLAASFVCSSISEKPTASVFCVTKLVHVTADVRQMTTCQLHRKVCGNLANHSYRRCKSGWGLYQSSGS